MFVVTVLAEDSIPSNLLLSDADIKPLAEVVAVPPVSATVPPRHQPPLIGVAHLDLALVADEHMHIIDELHDRHTPAERTPVDGLDRPIVAYPFVTALAVRSTAVTAVLPETRKVLVHRTFARTAPELFTVMEDAVRNCDTVKEACAELEKTEHCAVHRLCMQDEEYRKAREKYEEIVTKAYAASVKENEK